MRELVSLHDDNLSCILHHPHPKEIYYEKNKWIKLIRVGESMALSLSDTPRWVKEHYIQLFWLIQACQSEK